MLLKVVTSKMAMFVVELVVAVSTTEQLAVIMVVMLIIVASTVVFILDMMILDWVRIEIKAKKLVIAHYILHPRPQEGFIVHSFVHLGEEQVAESLKLLPSVTLILVRRKARRELFFCQRQFAAPGPHSLVRSLIFLYFILIYQHGKMKISAN